MSQNPKVIHHIWMFIMDPSFSYKKKEGKSNIVPGKNFKNSVLTGSSQSGNMGVRQHHILAGNYHKYKSGYKWPQKSPLLLEIHYESIGKKMTDDRTHINLYFYKRKTQTQDFSADH